MKQNKIFFSSFEKAVMEKFFNDRIDDVMTILKQQYKKSKVESRWFSGKGFFITFDIPRGVPYVKKSVHITGVEGRVNGIEVGFMLHVKEGYLKFLEGFTYDEPWPAEITSYELWADKEERERK